MIHHQVRAWARKQALPVLARPPFQLLLARWLVEIRGRPADVVDVSLKLRIPGQKLCFLQDRFIASYLNDPTLVEVQRAEIACAEASSVRGNGKLHFGKSRNPACLLIVRVPVPGIGKVVYVIHLLCGKRPGRRVLDHIYGSVRLDECPGVKRICIPVLLIEAHCVVQAVLLHLRVIRKQDAVAHAADVLCPVAGSGDKGQVMHVQPRIQSLSDLQNRVLPHSIGNEIGAAVHEQGSSQAVAPIVIMRHPPEGCFDPAHYDRCLLIDRADQIAVYHRSPVRAKPHHAARAVGIHFSALFRDGIMVHHGVHVSGRDQEPKAGLSEYRDAGGILPVGLRQDADLEPMSLQHPRQDRRAEGRMIHIGIPGHKYKVRLQDPSLFHVPARDRKKLLPASGLPLLLIHSHCLLCLPES